MKNKTKHPKTPQQKEDFFIKIGTRILLAITIIVAIVYSVIVIKNSINNSDYKLLEELCKEIDTSEFLTDPIGTQHETSLLTKLEGSGLDLIEDDIITYEKYNQTEISITENITFTSNEFAVLYSSIFLYNPDKYEIDLKQLTYEECEDGYKIKSICTINLKSMISGFEKLPARVYLINECKIKSGVISPLSTQYNNLSVENSKTITNTINNSANIDIERYVAKLLLKFSTNLAMRTNCDMIVNGSNIAFNLKTS